MAVGFVDKEVLVVAEAVGAVDEVLSGVEHDIAASNDAAFVHDVAIGDELGGAVSIGGFYYATIKNVVGGECWCNASKDETTG